MDDHQNDALRIILVRRTGSRKSAMANTILGEEKFVSKISAQVVTSTCQKGTREWKERHLLLVDTPGLFDTKETLETTCAEISHCVLCSSPGPHAILMVLQLGRYTLEEQSTVALIKAVFGKEAMKNMIVLFTCKEELEGQSIGSFIEDANVKLIDIIRECGNLCMAISNKADKAEKEVQVQNLVELIEKMVQNNGWTYFSNPIYEDTEESVKEHVKVLKEIYTEKRDEEIRQIEMEYADKLGKEREENIEYVKMKYDEKIGNIREEAEKDIIIYIKDKICKIRSTLWHMFWERCKFHSFL